MYATPRDFTNCAEIVIATIEAYIFRNLNMYATTGDFTICAEIVFATIEHTYFGTKMVMLEKRKIFDVR